MQQRSLICGGFGYALSYQCGCGIRVYCICPAGDDRITHVKKALSDVGIDPDDPKFEFRRYKVPEYY